MPSPHRFKLGRQPRRHDLSIPSYGQMKAMLRSTATPIPPLLTKVDHAAALPGFVGMMLNDTEGCCTCAGMGHETQLVTEDAQGAEITPPDSAVQEAYEACGGYVPGDPSTDNGCDEQTVLSWWRSTGIALPDGSRHRINGYVEIDKTRLDYICDAIQNFGCVYIGFQVPAGLMDAGPPNLWDDDPSYTGIDGGHCVVVPSFDRTDPDNVVFGVISWGTKQWRMTQAFFEKYVDEVYVLIDPLWIEKTGQTPLGLSEAQLEAIARAL